MKKKLFINLTCGIEAIQKYGLKLDDISFIRVQSSHCEAHDWEKILKELDHNFLMHLAMGYECIVYDFGANARQSKAVYFGLEWVRYFLYRRWLNIDHIPVVKGKKVTNYFEMEYEKISRKTRHRIDYYRNFLFTDEIKIKGITSSTKMDNKKDYYAGIIKDALQI